MIRRSEGRDALDIDLIWVSREAEYFLKWGWTAKPPGSLVGQISKGRMSRAISGAARAIVRRPWASAFPAHPTRFERLTVAFGPAPSKIAF
jgi:hypothetical protein